ncbi:MAG: hypothetical protein J1F18_00990 [Lachnospiraceae bacterium]|nr:hypothetical protein [Lachnospiraceae bacterium]
MSKTDEEFEHALIGKKIPILTLDNKWYQLFTESEHTAEIKRMESEMNDLIKRQSKVSDENREIKKLKKKLMDEIVVLADELVHDPSSKRLAKKQDECKRLLQECNEKLDANEEEMVELPRQINWINRKLMVATMEICYRKLAKSTEELSEIEEWIGKVRRELKKKIIRKQEKEAKIHQLYSYMHDIFGSDVIELFDMHYDPEEKYQKAQEAKEAKVSRETQGKKETQEAKEANDAPIKSEESVNEQSMNDENASKS